MEKVHSLKMEVKWFTRVTFRMALSMAKATSGTTLTKLNMKETSREIKWKVKAK
jgi:hypothetical protein